MLTITIGSETSDINDILILNALYVRTTMKRRDTVSIIAQITWTRTCLGVLYLCMCRRFLNRPVNIAA